MGVRLGQWLWAGVLGIGFAGSAVAQADMVTVKRDAQLRESPGEASTSLGALPVQTPLTRLSARQGPWIEVRNAQGQTGWVHMFDIGSPPSAQGGNVATGALRGLTSLFGRGNTLAPTRTATVGIRGLGAEELANAQPNLSAVMMVETLRLDAAQAQQFAHAAALSAHSVEALPVPPRPNNAPAAGAAGLPGANR